jgi:hypothetical protein
MHLFIRRWWHLVVLPTAAILVFLAIRAPSFDSSDMGDLTQFKQIYAVAPFAAAFGILALAYVLESHKRLGDRKLPT